MNMITSCIKEDGVAGGYEWRVAMQIRYLTTLIINLIYYLDNMFNQYFMFFFGLIYPNVSLQITFITKTMKYSNTN